ncbi:HEL286Cp [Eremothecium sinecaudum]|uniref:mRNA export factor GLE1 n=1 Tax=Eremothecium sinecaudum TaxID=45286 RepID=A0A0X8HT51_9SACH|nr:HEL286Cp [Eremothecium sinecaudum]AMD20995.1 HEL286Cp [Eremothecium sinecaudum]
MRFSIDELLDDADSVGIEHSYIGDAADGIQLKLPKFNFVKKDKIDELHESVQAQLAQLNISDKLPKKLSMRFPVSTLHNAPSLSRKASSDTTVPYIIEGDKINVPDGLEIIQFLKNKMARLEEDNNAQVDKVMAQKKQLIEERKRREMELKKKEAEKLKQEEEEKRQLQKQKEAELAAKAAEQRATEMEQRRRAEEERQLHERQKQEQQELAKQEAKKGKYVTSFAAVEAAFLENKKRIESIKHDIVGAVSKDGNLKKLLGAQKRKINPKFGQLTNSTKQLHLILGEMFKLIDEVKQNELAYQWILNFISKAIVSQAETEVRVKPESAVPLATLTLHLLMRYVELKEFFLARLIKKCPFIIGFSCNIDTEEGRIRMGWKRSGDNKWEDDTSYEERIGGIMTIFAVITRLPLPAEFINLRQHPLSLSYSWQILARVANKQPESLTNTHFILLGCWWDAAAAQFLQYYGSQGGKLLKLIASDLTAKVAAKRFVGAARLRILLEEWETKGTIKTFSAMVA